MKGRCRSGWVWFILVSLWVLLSGCGDEPGERPRGGETSRKQEKSTPRLDVIAGSESKHIEDIILDCAGKHRIEVRMHYSGSVDMMLGMKQKKFKYDAVLPASTIWLRLGDQGLHRVKEEASIMRSPVVLGIKRSIAESLGWIHRDISISDILEAVRSDRFRFAMTSATQSNSGFSSYMGMLIALAGKPDVLTEQHLDGADLRRDIKELLGGVNRGSGSSGWLMKTFLEDYERLDAMFNYESMMIAANRRLVEEGREPLYIIYPVDGLAVADSTLGFIDKPENPDNRAKKEAFVKLRDCLLSGEVQARILRTGFRTGLIGMNPEDAPRDVYNPSWGIDLKRTISPIVWPDAEVTYKALTLYQTAFRKPSLTAFAVDCSGSMKGRGLTDLKRALTDLFDSERAGRYLIQTGEKDIILIIPFDDSFLWDHPLMVKGNDPGEMQRLIERINALETRGATNLYRPIAMAWDIFMDLGKEFYDYLPSIVLMTDGASNRGSLETLMEQWEIIEAPFDLPPVFCIMYGQASDEQLEALARRTYGRVFDGRNDGLAKAFRSAKGYN